MGEDIWGSSSNPASLASIRRKSGEEKKPLDEKPQAQPENLDLTQEALAADDTSEQNSTAQNSIEQNSAFTKQNFIPQNSAEQNLAFAAQGLDEENSILRDSAATGSGEQDSNGKDLNSTKNAASSQNFVEQNSTWQNLASLNSDRINSTQSSTRAYDLNKAYVFYMFLGPFGAHRFYLGRIISAIFQLLGGLPFLIWLFLVVVTVMWTSIEGNDLLALINSSRPDLGVQASDLKDIEQGFFHFMVIFSVPNVLFLIWLVSDFFRLPDMVRKLNVSVGVGDITYLYADDVMECGESLSNAETALYVAFGLEVLSAVSGYIKNADKAGALQGIGIILVICLAVGLYFLARAIRSTDLLSNAAIAGVFSTISALIIVFIGFGLFKPSVFALCVSCVCMLVYLIYRLLISKELYDCSGEKDYLRAFYVIATTEMITLVLAILGSQLLVLVSTIGQVVAAVLNISAVYATKGVTASKGGYNLANLAYHVRQMNRREF
ncbi:TM2 domain-containing protein [Campylobacter gracilis]|uniref:TM2 domain protein n=1 Tax=Campylobacter gracilis RM3268 TaxID=553220 RepID=C8PKS6_9BACT|nr:TM2 domain-containing protein [Campylobacter gracilis]AKT91496.1 putative membrane protein [Campylobacter gracilis]EEV16685.1 TM2 domain protein [Campylobacter gracilis RM3268]UEB46293.1 TM2 domain-containing protein [Campylobacter gracilis]SUW78066.1 TM2 domain [Campylobacter gracilis]